MENDFRRRVLVPVLMPLGVLIGIGVFVISISRVMLATPATVSTFTALAVAGYILFLSFMVSARRRITGRALGVGLVLGLVAVLAAGVVAAAAGPREIVPHGEEEAGAEPEPGAEGEEDAAGEVPADALVWTAVDIEFSEAPAEASAGELTFAIVNEGNLVHNVAIEGENGNAPVVEADGGGTDVGTITLDAGTYTYFCAVPGHRATMEGTLEVSG